MFKRLLKNNKAFYYGLLLPSIIFFLLIVVFPLIYTLVLSLQQYNLTNPTLRGFIGLKNYWGMIINKRFWMALGRSLYYTFFSVGLSFIIGFITALILSKKKIIGNNIFRSIFLIPMITAPMVIGSTFRYLLNPSFGIVNYLLQLIGLPKLAFLGDSSLALNSLIMVDIWQWAPFMILVLLAGFESLPKEPFEAAQIDGANFWQELVYITIPLLKPIISIAVLIRTMDAFRAFDKIFMMTSGGPGSSTETLSFYVYKVGFQYFRMGDAAAMGIFMLYFIVFLSWLYMKTLDKTLTKEGGKLN